MQDDQNLVTAAAFVAGLALAVVVGYAYFVLSGSPCH